MARPKEVILETTNYRIIERVCDDSFINSKMTAIIGYPGAGKTTALTEYSNKSSNIYYIVVEPSMTPKMFYQKVLYELGDTNNNKDLPLNYAINKAAVILNETSENKLLIIDEAGKFTQRMLIHLHELRDKTRESTGIVLAGPEYFEENLKKMSAKGVIGMPELESRINQWQKLVKPTKTEIKAICKEYKVDDAEFVNRMMKEMKDFRRLHNAILDYHYRQENTQKK